MNENHKTDRHQTGFLYLKPWEYSITMSLSSVIYIAVYLHSVAERAVPCSSVLEPIEGVWVSPTALPPRQPYLTVRLFHSEDTVGT